MDGNGQPGNGSTALHWPGRVLAADDVRFRLNGHSELILLPRTIVTQLALDELRTKGIRITRQETMPAVEKKGTAGWSCAQEKPDSMVRSAIESVKREGMQLGELPGGNGSSVCLWAKEVSECVASGQCRGGVIFCHDPGLVCCVANKCEGLRAAAVSSVVQAARAVSTLGANLVAVEVPGRTFFELRQILRALCAGDPACPDGLACVLKEMETHANR